MYFTVANRQLPVGWEIKTLGQVIKLEYGKHLPDEVRVQGGKYPVYGANGVKCWSDKYYFDRQSIIVGRKGSAGEVNITDEKFWPLDVTYFVTYDNTQYDLIFLYYCLKHLRLAKLAKGVKPGINRNDVYQIQFIFPPLPEQKQIVAILDEAFEGIDSAIAIAEKNLANARELFESYLNVIFTQKNDSGEIFKLEDICDKTRVITYGVIKLGEHIDNGVPCLRTSNVRWLDIDLNGIKRISPSLSADYKRTILKGGEVLVNVRGTLGGVAVTTPQMAGWNISREVALVPIDIKRAYPTYLAYWIGAKTNQQWLSSVEKGAAYTGINIEDLRTLPVVVPDLKKQERLINSIKKVHFFSQNLENIYRQKIATLKELKQSILQKAFTGELTADTAKNDYSAIGI